MGEIIPRVAISKFKRECKGGMELPVVVTSDGEDAFAVVPVAWFAAAERSASGYLQSLRGVDLVRGMACLSNSAEEEARWIPPDLARDT